MFSGIAKRRPVSLRQHAVPRCSRRDFQGTPWGQSVAPSHAGRFPPRANRWQRPLCQPSSPVNVPYGCVHRAFLFLCSCFLGRQQCVVLFCMAPLCLAACIYIDNGSLSQGRCPVGAARGGIVSCRVFVSHHAHGECAAALSKHWPVPGWGSSFCLQGSSCERSMTARGVFPRPLSFFIDPCFLFFPAAKCLKHLK